MEDQRIDMQKRKLMKKEVQEREEEEEKRRGNICYTSYFMKSTPRIGRELVEGRRI